MGVLVNLSHSRCDMFSLLQSSELRCLFSTDNLQEAERRGSPRGWAGIKITLEC